jgi:hypothetical protein
LGHERGEEQAGIHQPAGLPVGVGEKDLQRKGFLQVLGSGQAALQAFDRRAGAPGPDQVIGQALLGRQITDPGDGVLSSEWTAISAMRGGSLQAARRRAGKAEHSSAIPKRAERLGRREACLRIR